MRNKNKQNIKRYILDAAKEIVLKEGHDVITVRKIADITGYSYPNLYYYFKDINSLLWLLRLDMIEDMINEFSNINFTHENPIKEIIDTFKHYTSYYFRHPNIFRFFYFYPFKKPENDNSYKDLEQRLNGMWYKSFYRLVKNDIISDSDVEIIAKNIIYSLHGMIMLSLSSNGAMEEKDIIIELERIINYLLKQ